MIAAKAIYDITKEKNVEIVSVSGSSAGAIAAAVLATGRDPQEFIDKFMQSGTLIADPIVNVRRPCLLYIYGMLGWEILCRKKLEDFIKSVFDGFLTFGDLPIELWVFVTDLKNRKSAFYNKRTDVLADALAQSAAIPFLLHTYRHESKIVDGGWVNNLPVAHLLRSDAGLKPGDIIGISFHDEESSKDIKSLAQYLLALIASAINCNVSRSIEILPEENVHAMPVPTSLLNFRQGLEDMKGARRKGYEDNVRHFMSKLITRKYLESATILHEELATRIQAYYVESTKNVSLHCEHAVVEWTSFSLQASDHHVSDTCDCSYNMYVNDGIVHVMRFGYVFDGLLPDITDIDISIRDGAGNKRETTILPIGSKTRDEVVSESNVIVFLHTPFCKGERFVVSYQIRAREVLYELGKGKSDVIGYCTKNFDFIKEILMIANVPSRFSGLILGPVPLSEQDRSMASWVDGRQATSAEIDKHSRPRVGFRKIGWHAMALRKNDGTGMSVCPT